MRPEYWFSVPRTRVDDLYAFLQFWVPHLYGELSEEQVRARGFSLVELDTELWSDEPTPSSSRHNSQDGEIAELTRESWEVCKGSGRINFCFCFMLKTCFYAVHFYFIVLTFTSKVTEELRSERFVLCWTVHFFNQVDGFEICFNDLTMNVDC